MKEIRIAMASILLASTFASAIDVDPYGFIRFNGVWSDGVISGFDPNGVIFANPVYSTEDYVEGRASRFSFGASQSTVGVNLSDSVSEGKLVLTGKLEGDFTGRSVEREYSYGLIVHSYNFIINHGFVNFSFPSIGLSILFGQTDALFVPYNPPTINYRNLIGMGNLNIRKPQIRLTQKISSIEIAVAVRENGSVISPTRENYGDYPAIEGKISTTGPVKIGASAFWISRKEAGFSSINYYHWDDPDSYGLAADIFAAIGIVSVSGEFFLSQNNRDYGGLYSYDFDNSNKPQSMGGWGALGFKASDNLSINAGAGSEYIINEYYGMGHVWLNRAIFANINYKLTPNASLALEYFRHDTEYMDDKTGSYNRIETAITYGF